MKRIPLILFSSIILMMTGVAVACYNTASFGYDNANLISTNETGIQILDFEIRYEQVRELADKAVETMPDKFITI